MLQFEVFDKTTNYDAHPSRGTVLFVKAILTADCEALVIYDRRRTTLTKPIFLRCLFEIHYLTFLSFLSFLNN